MPPVTNEYDTTLATKAYDLAKAWHTSDLMGVGSEWYGEISWGSYLRWYRQISREWEVNDVDISNRATHDALQTTTGA
jgi:hypothetical protein